MTPDKAFAAIMINIDTFKEEVEKEWNFPSECKNFPAWLSVLDDHIASELRGLKIMCFDNGIISSYTSYEKKITCSWKAARKYLNELIEGKC